MQYVGLLVTILTLPTNVIADSHEKQVGISSTMMKQKAMHDGEAVVIKRNKMATIQLLPDYSLTSRLC